MAKRPQAKYAPGELEKVRKRLGEIDREEAKKLADLLGGEVGIERDDEELGKKYSKIREKAYQERLYKKQKKGKKRSTSNKDYVNSESLQDYSRPRNQSQKAKIGFFDRIKLDFLCSRPEYQIKQFSGAFFSIFSFFLQIPDTLNPKFLKDSDSIFYTSLSNFVNAVRKLFSKKHQFIFKEIIKNGYYAKILATIKEWDINGINLELNSLKRFKSKINIASLKKLTRMVYKPIILFHEVDEEKDILEAINHAYHINMQNTEDKGANYTLIEKSFFEAKTNLTTVFYEIKRIFYPLLVKYTSAKFYEYHDYFVHEFDNILAFLQISKDDLISPNKTYELPVSDSAEETIKDQNNNEKSPKTRPSEKGSIDPVQIQAKNLLVKLFPKAGFDNLSTMPDLFPYFSSLFDFPEGYELIPSNDPIHQILILSYIINQLLQGFRHIKFGIAKNSNLESIFLQKKIDSLLVQWIMVIEDLLNNEYIHKLLDFCLQIDRDLNFIKTESAQKIKNELNLIKKTYILPYIDISSDKGTSIRITKKELPKLYQITQEFMPILAQITEDLNRITHEYKQALAAGKKIILKEMQCNTIENPWDKFRFDVPNTISKRLNQILVSKIKTQNNQIKNIDKRTNSQLIYFAHSLITLLDFWLNNPTSHLYKATPYDIYRKKGMIPDHHIDKIDPYIYFIEEVDLKNSLQQHYSSNFQKADLDQIIRYIDSLLDKSNNTGAFIQLVGLNPTNCEKSQYFHIEKQIQSLFKNKNDKIFFYENQFYILSPNLETNHLFGVLKRLLKPFSSCIISINVISFLKNTNLNQTYKIFQKLQILSKENIESKILYFDPLETKVKSYKINS